MLHSDNGDILRVLLLETLLAYAVFYHHCDSELEGVTEAIDRHLIVSLVHYIHE